jgi:hypothetical protein
MDDHLSHRWQRGWRDRVVASALIRSRPRITFFCHRCDTKLCVRCLGWLCGDRVPGSLHPALPSPVTRSCRGKQPDCVDGNAESREENDARGCMARTAERFASCGCRRRNAPPAGMAAPKAPPLPEAAGQQSSSEWLMLVSWIWLAGVVLMAVRLAWGTATFARRIRPHARRSGRILRYAK